MSWSGAKLVDRVGIGTESVNVCAFFCCKVLCLRVSNVEQVMS